MTLRHSFAGCERIESYFFAEKPCKLLVCASRGDERQDEALNAVATEVSPSYRMRLLIFCRYWYLVAKYAVLLFLSSLISGSKQCSI